MGPVRGRSGPGRTGSLVAALVVLLLGLLGCGAGWLRESYEAERFAHHAAVADAVIIDSDVACLGALGGPWEAQPEQGFGGWEEAITYRVRFSYRGGTHVTDVTKPCGVIPPDFGRGRGAIWVEYDVDDPDRIRVLTDDTAARRARWWREGALTCVAAGLVLLLTRRRAL